MSFLDNILQGGVASDLATTNTPVNVSSSTPPNPGDVLTAVDAENATWQPGGGAGGNAGGLETAGDPVDVSGALPPVAGQVLTAVDPEHAEWRVPGLHYDPGIKFWTSSAGSATIGPGSWGFIQQPVGGVDPVTVYIVSSLEAPPVDSRFGLYVGRDVTAPVLVQVLGASQIQGLDGVLGPSASLLPGADYEWVFYHEDGAALWGLVSDTAGVAKRIAAAGGTVEVASSAAPTAGQVLVALDAEHAAWSDVGPAVWPTLGDAFTNAIHVDAIVSSDSDLYGNSGGTETDGIGYGVELTVLAVAQSDPSENGFWVTHDGTWPRGLPLPEDTLVGQLVVVDDGTEFAGSMWTYRGDGQWDQISPGSPIAGGDFMVRVGKEIHLVGPITAGVHGNLSGGALHADATTTVSGFFSGAEKVKLAGIATGAAALANTTPFQITAGAAASAGTDTVASRRDHLHSISIAAPVALTVGGSNGSGSATSVPRSDHTHQLPAFGSTTGTFAQGNDTRFLKAATLSSASDVSIAGAGTPVTGQTLVTTGAAAATWQFPAMFGALNQCRLSATTDSIPTVDLATASTIYLTPHCGSIITLYSSTLAQVVPISVGAGVSLALTGLTTDVVYDVFAYLTNPAAPLSGTVGLELLAWTNTTTRATNIGRSTTNGMWTKNGDATRRYVGTIRARSATSISWRLYGSDGNPPRFDLWNVDNQVQLRARYAWNTATFFAGIASSWFAINGVNGRCEFVVGVQMQHTLADAYLAVMPGNTTDVGLCAISFDSGATPSSTRTQVKAGGATESAASIAAYEIQSPIGSHYLQWIAFATATGVTFKGASVSNPSEESGLKVTHWC